MRIALVAVALLAFPSTGATATSESSVESTTQNCPHPIQAQHRLAGHALALRHWRRPAVGPGWRRAESSLLDCAPRSVRGRLVSIWHGARRALYRYRALRLIAPYPGPRGSWWAIPWRIVNCESGGSWAAYNPSGAEGPYQLLGQGAPWPVRSWRDRMRHHRIARALWRERGSGPWTASQGCWG